MVRANPTPYLENSGSNLSQIRSIIYPISRGMWREMRNWRSKRAGIFHQKRSKVIKQILIKVKSSWRRTQRILSSCFLLFFFCKHDAKFRRLNPLHIQNQDLNGTYEMRMERRWGAKGVGGVGCSDTHTHTHTLTHTPRHTDTHMLTTI